MPNADRYAVQTFIRNPRGRFSVGRSIACKNADEARQRAEESCKSKVANGAAAFLLRGDDDIGDTEHPITLAVFGDVPPEISDDIPF